MARNLAGAALSLALALGSLGVGVAAHAGPEPTVDTVDDGLYVVVLKAPPLAAFAGDAGGEATTPRPGHRFHADTTAAAAYRARLAAEQQQLLDELGSPEVLYSYTTALNGFAARLTTAQVKQLAASSSVLTVQPSTTDRLDQVTGSADAVTAATAPIPPAARAGDQAGRGVVVAMIDTGIWPENPSFAGSPLDRATRNRLYPGFTGTCTAAERWSRSACNDKIVAADWFVKGFGADDLSSAEYLSARDGSGHGSHTAAIAAGNADVDVTIDGQRFGELSGAAPGAALAIYKACWSSPNPAHDGCTTADTVAAIDQAVSDGVDVINYSASSPSHKTDDPVQLAFLNAAAAGVFVSTSAGDGGPAPGSVGYSAPWITTVGASTASGFGGTVRLGDGRAFAGSMVSDQTVARAPLVYARDAARRGVDRGDAALCLPGTLDASVADGAVVICDRGDSARITKSAEVQQAGGVAMVLANTAPGGSYADVHAVPTVQVPVSEGDAIKRYAARAATPTAVIGPATTSTIAAPTMTDFSGRGPVAGSDVLKPDLTAPGVDIVSAVAPPSNFGRLWDLYSGTSMAAPRVAGTAAVIRAAHPLWSPAAVKSALQTTATPLADGAGPLQRGAGELAPLAARDPGLVYDTPAAAWRHPDDARLNQASIAVSSLVAETRVSRTVTNVGGRSETYTAQLSGLRGVAARVNPSTLRLAPGESATFRVTFTAQRAARYGAYTAGTLTWTGSLGHRVTSPVAVHPELLDPPADARGSGVSGDLTVRATAGVTGTVRAAVVGPVAATPTAVDVVRGPFDSTDPATGAAAENTFDVRAGTAAVRFETTEASGDVDLYVYRDGRLVASSATTASDEQVTIDAPRPGEYTVYVAAAGDTSDERVSATFTGWVLRTGDAGSVDVSPRRTQVTGTRPVDFGLSWNGLPDNVRWFGLVRYPGSDRVTHLTLN